MATMHKAGSMMFMNNDHHYKALSSFVVVVDFTATDVLPHSRKTSQRS
jgi:hypothetical protein